jgi:hypothetical protein
MRNDGYIHLCRQHEHHPRGVLSGTRHEQVGVLTEGNGECSLTPHAQPHGGARV